MRRIIFTIVLVLVGVGALVYPFVSNYFAEKNASEAVQIYAEKVVEFDKAKAEVMRKEAEIYNENLTGYPVHDPFIEGTGIAMSDDYRQVLDVDGIMGFIEIPKIKVNLPIYHGTSEAVLKVGIGHLEGSTLPVGGDSRHCVLTGHTGLTNAKLFTDLTELKQGDLFYLHVLGETLAYRVDQIKIIEPNITEDLKRFADKDYVTLLTCTPYGVNSHRLLVRGERVDYIPEVKEAIVPLAMTTANTMVIRAAIVTSAIMLVFIIITFIVTRRKSKREDKVVTARPRRGTVVAGASAGGGGSGRSGAGGGGGGAGGRAGGAGGGASGRVVVGRTALAGAVAGGGGTGGRVALAGAVAGGGSTSAVGSVVGVASGAGSKGRHKVGSKVRGAHNKVSAAGTRVAKDGVKSAETRTPKHSLLRARFARNKFVMPRGANHLATATASATKAAKGSAVSSTVAATSVVPVSADAVTNVVPVSEVPASAVVASVVTASSVVERWEPLRIMVTRKLALCLEVPD